MAVSRVQIVDEAFRASLSRLEAHSRKSDLDQPVRADSSLTGRQAIAIFEAQIESRLLDVISRRLKKEGKSFYTIGSSGHEGNAAVAAALRPTDPAFLHYRSGGFFLARAQQVPGPAGALDMLLGMVASSDEPIAGGRHKVFGSVDLHIPPQTSTIASHLPKALGCAVALDRQARLTANSDERIVVCTFGDASSNHASATTALNAASWTAHQKVPAPLLFVCEDNGFGISVRTPKHWIHANLSSRPGIAYFYADGLDLIDAFDAARLAAQHVRQNRSPAILHLRTIRLLGHAGSDVEQLYRSAEEIADSEAQDPLIASAQILVESGCLTPDEILNLYTTTERRLSALAIEATSRPKLTSAQAVMAPLFFHDEEAVSTGIRTAPKSDRETHFGQLPEHTKRPRHLAYQINRCLADLLMGYEKAIIFGEDVAQKGGVYHVTAGLKDAFGLGRVFNTLLDETSILGLAIGAGHAGMLPIPEIQYLAYLINAIDQLRGEAASLQFFSNGQYSNPMVVRIAALAYQKGFGGHFHNDQGIGALREIPGLLIGCPSNGADAVRMLRTMVSAADTHGRVCVMLEPIALYMKKDLHEDGDGMWLTEYPPPQEGLNTQDLGVYGDGTDLCIASYANGLWMSLRVAKRLAADGIRARVVDMRWLQPLPMEAILAHARECGRLLVVDECRKSSGIADAIVAEVYETLGASVKCLRVQAPDTYIPLGAAANLVLVTEADIDDAARRLMET